MKTKTKIKRYLKKNYWTVVILFNITIVGVAANFNLLLHEPFVETNIVKAEPDIKIYPESTPMRDWVLTEVYKAGLNPEEADKIIACESSWNDYAYNVNWEEFTTDAGLWQINSIHKAEISVKGRFDYKTATKWAIEKRLHDGNWSAWVCSNKL